MHTSQFLSLRDLLSFTARQRRRIVNGLLATLALVAAATLITPPAYQSYSLVLVKFGREYLYRAEVGERGTITPGTGFDRRS